MVVYDLSIRILLDKMEFHSPHGEKERLPTEEEVFKVVRTIPADSLLENITVISIKKSWPRETKKNVNCNYIDYKTSVEEVLKTINWLLKQERYADCKFRWYDKRIEELQGAKDDDKTS